MEPGDLKGPSSRIMALRLLNETARSALGTLLANAFLEAEAIKLHGSFAYFAALFGVA